MADVYTISVKAAGPLIVSGPLLIVDPQGGEWELEEGKSVGLCRCGQSKRKPFCDRTHFELKFDHPEPVNPETVPDGVRPRS
jgi:CDGSH iron-sulfur domain-containing protein 3